jgi:hypothetical protein
LAPAHLLEQIAEVRLAGIKPHGLGQFRSGRLAMALAVEHNAEASVPDTTVGLQSERGEILGLAFAEASLLDQQEREGAMDVGVHRVEPHGLGEGGHGLIVPSGLDEGLGQGTVCTGQGRIEFQRDAELAGGLIEPPAIVVRDAQVVVGVGRRRGGPHVLGETRRRVRPGRLRSSPDPALTPAQRQ